MMLVVLAGRPGTGKTTLRVGTPVVVDAVNPVPEARSGWRGLAAETGAGLVVVELTTADAAEHRRRVEARGSDLEGLTVPTWEQASQGEYVPWDEGRDGPRLLLDTSGGVAVLVDRVLAECAPDAGDSRGHAHAPTA